jgi:predicted nucleic acid-binding Zn ribbon protein
MKMPTQTKEQLMATAKKKKPSTKTAKKPTKTVTKAAPKAKAKPVAPKPAAPKAAEAAVSKKTQLQTLMQRPEGATIDEMAKASGWQKHTVRGFLSMLKKAGQTVTNERENDERRYKMTTV